MPEFENMVINNATASHTVLGADHGRVIRPGNVLDRVRARAWKSLLAASSSAVKDVTERDNQMLFGI